jgi:DNA-binding IclR family transcriptional regulator
MKPHKISNLPQTVRRALDILESFINPNEGFGITELSNKVKLSKSTTYRIIQALKAKGYIKQDVQSNKYYLGYKILKIANSFLNQNKLRVVARKYLEELSTKTLHSAQLAILEDCEVVYIDQVEGNDIFQLRFQIGNRGPLYCTAAGKSILAFLTENELENVLNNLNLIPITKKTITSIEHLKKEIRTIKKNGFSFCDGEYDKYIRAIGSPIIGLSQKVIGAVILTAPSNRIKLKEVHYYGNMTKEAAIKISLEMGGHIQATRKNRPTQL